MNMTKLKNKLEKRQEGAIVIKPCPICGSAPFLSVKSLDFGDGHGYPGNYMYHYNCPCCGILETDGYSDVYDMDGEHPLATIKVAKEWNELVDYVNGYLERKGNKGQQQ